jgi:hypothetical protein
MFPGSVNEPVEMELVGLCVGGGLLAVGGGVGMFVGVVGILVGIVGMFVGVVGILVGIVGIGVMTGGGFIGGDIMPIDRRARPSSGSTEIDAFLLDLRPVARPWLCSWSGFIVFSPDVTFINRTST